MPKNRSYSPGAIQARQQKEVDAYNEAKAVTEEKQKASTAAVPAQNVTPLPAPKKN